MNTIYDIVNCWHWASAQEPLGTFGPDVSEGAKYNTSRPHLCLYPYTCIDVTTWICAFTCPCICIHVSVYTLYLCGFKVSVSMFLFVPVFVSLEILSSLSQSIPVTVSLSVPVSFFLFIRISALLSVPLPEFL